MFGVSPAYFFSSYTTTFTVEDYARGFELLAAEGFKGYQPEIFTSDRIEEWDKGAGALAARGTDIGLSATQFVAHFLLAATKDESALFSDLGYREIAAVAKIATRFPGCATVTLPIAPFTFPAGHSFDADAWLRAWDRLKEKLLRLASIVEAEGLRMSLEIVPGSLLGGTEGFMHFIAETGNTTIGYNFDTGHAWACKESIATLPAKLAGRIYGTHLKDNFGYENLALPPGDGSIPWKSVIDGLLRTGYRGSFDLEIACATPDEVQSAYARGRTTLEKVLNASSYKHF